MSKLTSPVSMILGPNQLKNNPDWLEDETSCQLICDAVKLLDGSSLDHLYSLTPFILRLTDNYQPANKLKGLFCLTTLMNVYTLGDLKSANFHQLFWQTLKTLLYNDDIELNKLLVPTLLRFIDKFSLGQDEKDECFNQLIKNQLFASPLALKIIYINGILQFLTTWSEELIKFTQSLLEVTLNCVQGVVNQETYELILPACQVLELIIGKNGKLCYIYADKVVLAFIKLKFNMSESNLNGDQSQELNRKIESCLHLMKATNPKLLIDYCNLIKEKLPGEDFDTNFVITFLMNCHNH